MISKQSPEIGKAVGILKVLSQSEETRELYNIREKNKRDERAKLSYSLSKGIEQGIEQGAKEKSYEIALKAIKKGMDIEDIIEITNLTYEEIENLQNNSYATN